MEALFKQYFWVVKALGITVSAALAASALTTYFGTSYIYGEPDEEEAATGGETEGAEDEDEDEERPVGNPFAAASGNRGPSAADRTKMIQTITGHNLFCPTCVPVVAATPDGAGATAPDFTDTPPGELPQLSGKQPGEGPCTLPLRLVATMIVSDPEYSRATIRDEETGGVGPYLPGDKIRPGVYLVSVERSMVHVKNQAALEYIELGVEPPKPQARPVAVATDKKEEDAPKANSSAIPGAEDAIKCESENSCTINREFIEQVLGNPAALAKQARVMPSVKDGETRGFKFYGIRPGSLPKLLGMKNGDLITAVNGSELKSMDGAMALYTKLRRASNLSISIERKGETITKEITIQ